MIKLRKLILTEAIQYGDNVKLKYVGHLKYDSFAKYFNGKTGVVRGIEKDGSTKMYRVHLDVPVRLPNVGIVKDDLWSAEFLKKVK